eukprot:GHUV01000188.1.p1 GENE.GHUV01000188.1~~GHUV01000188.1.p1  ORF type:complete len:209 (+),score=59.89 GHUV01000188.1:85-711(+)
MHTCSCCTPDSFVSTMATISARAQQSVAGRAARSSVARPATVSRSVRAVQVRAQEAAAPVKEEAPKWTEPTLDANTPSPIFGGSTGGLLKKAQVEEFYVITWEANKEQIFEMPTGGAAIMRKGPNLLKFARKEQCLALTSQLRNKFKINPCFYRVYPSGEVQYLHPKDGVYPEKVNQGRPGVNQNFRRIGENVNPIKVKFTGNGTMDI